MSSNTLFYRYRVRFARKFPASKLSHLEHINALRRMIASSGLDYVPLGTKRPDVAKISFGPALTAGYESTSEYADIYLKKFMSDMELFDKITPLTGNGFSVISVKRIPCHFPSVEALVSISGYEINTDFEVSDEEIEKFLEQERIPIKKIKSSDEEKTIDAKPLILSLEKISPRSISMILEFKAGSHLKPGLIMESMTGRSGFEILRSGLYWKNSKGELISP